MANLDKQIAAVENDFQAFLVRCCKEGDALVCSLPALHRIYMKYCFYKDKHAALIGRFADLLKHASLTVEGVEIEEMRVANSRSKERGSRIIHEKTFDRATVVGVTFLPDILVELKKEYEASKTSADVENLEDQCEPGQPADDEEFPIE